MTYKQYLRSEKWRQLRIAALKKADFRCQICNNRVPLDVHHRTYPKTWGSEPIEDLIALCKPCHKVFHDKFGTAKRERKWQPVKRFVVYKNGEVELMVMTKPEFIKMKETNRSILKIVKKGPNNATQSQ